MDNSLVVERLSSTRTLLEKPESWGQYHFAAYADGSQAPLGHSSACRWCLDGALHKTGRSGEPEWVYTLARNEIVKAIRERERHTRTGLWDFNDNPYTTHKDILSVLDRAIERVKGGQ
jgi:hypothetical protein